MIEKERPCGVLSIIPNTEFMNGWMSNGTDLRVLISEEDEMSPEISTWLEMNELPFKEFEKYHNFVTGKKKQERLCRGLVLAT